MEEIDSLCDSWGLTCSSNSSGIKLGFSIRGKIRTFTFTGIILCPIICLIMTNGNSAIILGLWPVHCLWTYYCILSTKQFGIVLKPVLCICISVPFRLWPLIGIVGSIIDGAAFGL